MKTTLLFVAITFISLFAKADNYANYKISDKQISELFNSSADVTNNLMMELGMMNNLDLKNKTALPVDEDKQMIAGIIALGSLPIIIGFFVPIHRFYLGTGGQNVKIFFLYFCTLSGLGCITLIDGITLLVNSSNSKYIDNPKFIMWG